MAMFDPARWEEVLSVLQSMPQRNVRHYTTAIKACSVAGRYEDVLRLFEEMKEAGIKPDLVIYNNVSHWHTSCCQSRSIIAPKGWASPHLTSHMMDG